MRLDWNLSLSGDHCDSAQVRLDARLKCSSGSGAPNHAAEFNAPNPTALHLNLPETGKCGRYAGPAQKAKEAVVVLPLPCRKVCNGDAVGDPSWRVQAGRRGDQSPERLGYGPFRMTFLRDLPGGAEVLPADDAIPDARPEPG